METAIDLSAPQTLQMMATADSEISGESLPFISEFHVNTDSDVEETNDALYIGNGQESSEDEEEEEEVVGEDGWRFGSSTPDQIPFTGASGLQVEMESQTPLDYLRLMLDDEMMNSIVTETNRYAAETLRGKVLSPQSRFRKWVEVTLPEMWAFFGLIIMMGLVVIEDLDDYWSLNEAYSLPLFRTVMRRDRFCLILSFLHLCNNNDQLPRDHADYDPLFKLRTFVSGLVSNFKQAFSPGPKIAIDEAMVAWRGHLSFRVYNPDKPDKFGIKVFELCDSETGYCSNLEFYTGRRQCSQYGATFDVVSRLAADYLNCGRTLFVDNHYTSPHLFTYLKANATLACGTMRLCRKHGPPKAMIPKLKKSDTTTLSLTNGTLTLLRFFDKREVNILTTAHDNSRVATGNINPVTNEPVIKLRAVAEYNKYMGAVDRSDQMVSYNAFNRRTLKWWKKAFFHMFMLGVLNAFIVHKATAVKKLAHRMFRRDLVLQLIQLAPVEQTIPRALGVGDSSVFRLTARHFLAIVKPKPGASNLHPQRICVVCSQAPGKKHSRSRYECPSCDVGLHIDPCFQIYHTREDFKQSLKRKCQHDQEGTSSFQS